MTATPTWTSLDRHPDEQELLQIRSRLRDEHHHLTAGQQEMVASEALQAVDPGLVCDALVADESIVPNFVALARRALDDGERMSWLTLSTLQAAALKVPTMLALAAHDGVAAPDRTTALRRAISDSDGALSRETCRELLRLGTGRWIRCNCEIADAGEPAARRSWQVARLASHEELIAITGARRRRSRRRRRAVRPAA